MVNQTRVTYLKDYTPPPYFIPKTFLHFDLGEHRTRVHARLEFQKNPAGPSGELILWGEDLVLLELALDGRRLDPKEFTLEPGALRIFNPPDQFTLSSTVEIYPEKNLALEGLYKTRGLFCTQCEAEGFRKITYFLDRPDVMSVYTVKITADPAYPVLLSNGNLLDQGLTPEGLRWALWEDPFKKPSYLFALVAGNLVYKEDFFTTRSGRKVTLQIYVEPKDLDKVDFGMASLKKAMAWDEEVFGREYDLDRFMIVAADDFNMGAMENKGLNVFNTSCLLASPQTTTDGHFARIEAIIAHEYFHNWSGNRVTCRDWFQLSLKEGFTVYRDQEFSSDMGSRALQRLEDAQYLKQHQFPVDAGPLAHPVRPDSYLEISNFYTNTVYEKGAEVIRMMALLLGPEAFRRGTDLYFSRHDGQAVTCEDFVKALEDASRRDLGQFRLWYSQAGTPRLQVTDSYDPKTQTYRLTVTQSCPPTPENPQKQPFHIPLAVGLVTSQGSTPTQVLELTQETHTFDFPGVAEKPAPSLLRNFSAPVLVDYPYTPDQLLTLARRDTDGYARWEAVQILGTQALRALVQTWETKGSLEAAVLDPHLLEVFQALWADPQVDPGMKASLLTLPTEAALGQAFTPIPVEAIHHARWTLRRLLAQALRAPWEDYYYSWDSSQPYDPSGPAQGRRSLKNLIHAYLATLEDPDLLQATVVQYHRASNFTEVSRALDLVVNWNTPEGQIQAQDLLDHFHRTRREDSLMMNHWFSVQADCRLPGTLDRIRALETHPAFDLKNPNKIRSLYGSFTQNNRLHFHQLDGSGYQFLADRILKLDPQNPQIASALLGPLTTWRRHTPQRQTLIQAQLQRILDTPGLSKDLFEVTSKALK